jgi:conjugative transfer region protein TrbK
MRARVRNVGAIARAVGFGVIAVAIVAASVYVQRNGAYRHPSLDIPSIHHDSLGAELAHCQAIGMAAQGDRECAAAWAANRRRFFEDRPTGSAAPMPDASPSATASPKNR